MFAEALRHDVDEPVRMIGQVEPLTVWQQGEATRRVLRQIICRVDDQHRLLHSRQVMTQVVRKGGAMTPMGRGAATQPLGEVACQHLARHLGPVKSLQVLPRLDEVATVFT